MIETLVSASVLSALISALIAYNRQRHFFTEQEKRYRQRQQEEDEKKANFIMRAFLQEAKYNLSIINLGNRGNNYKILFNTHCYELFKENIALLGINVADKINDLYLELFKSNADINGIYGNNYEILWTRVENKYLAPKSSLEKFIEFIDGRINEENK